VPALPFANRKRPLLLGHRGLPARAAGNTREAFLAAIEAGLDGIETDVQRTKDGVLVIHHDFFVGQRLLPQMSFAELRRRLPQIMTLAQLLEMMEPHHDFLLNIELKNIAGLEDGRAFELADALAAWSGKERVWVSSYDPVSLLKIRERRPSLPLAYIFRLYDSGRMAELLRIEAVHPHYGLITPEKVTAWHEKGLAVGAWTVNQPQKAAALAAAGVDVLMADDARALFAAKK